MANLDLQNQNLAQLLQALGGFTDDNQLTQPPLQSMQTSGLPQAGQDQQQQAPDLLQQLNEQQALPQQQAALLSAQQQPQQSLSQMPQDFSGLGLGETAPEVQQPEQQQPQISLQDILAILQQQGMGGL